MVSLPESAVRQPRDDSAAKKAEMMMLVRDQGTMVLETVHLLTESDMRDGQSRRVPDE